AAPRQRGNTASRGIRSWCPRGFLQGDPFECGYACVAMICAMVGRNAPPHALKRVYGETTRGLSISNIKEILEDIGFGVAILRFDPVAAGALPSPGIALTERGHYIVIGRCKARKIEVFDPAVGWQTRSPRGLSATLGGLGLEIVSVPHE